MVGHPGFRLPKLRHLRGTNVGLGLPGENSMMTPIVNNNFLHSGMFFNLRRAGISNSSQVSLGPSSPLVSPKI